MSVRRIGGSRTSPTRVTGPQYQGQVLARSPALYLRHGEAAGSTTMVDSSGNGRNGAYNGSPTLGVAPLIANDSDTAVTMNASGQFAEIGYATWMAGWTSFTLMGWIKRASIGSYHTILARDNTGSNGPWRLRVNDTNHLEFLLWHTGLTVLAGVSTLAANTRYHVAARYNGAQMTVHVNGSTDATVAATGALNSVDTPTLRVGGYGFGTAEEFNGTLDELQVYTTALTDAQILADYQAGA
jgi:hypothetical protein